MSEQKWEIFWSFNLHIFLVVDTQHFLERALSGKCASHLGKGGVIYSSHLLQREGKSSNANKELLPR